MASQEHEEDAVYDLMVRTIRQTVKGNEELARRLRRITIRRAKRALARAPTSRLWVILGDVYLSMKRGEECYRRALELDPSNMEACYEVARCEDFRGNTEEAATLLRLVVKKPPQDLETLVYGLAAGVFEKSGDKAQAAAARRKERFWRRREPKCPAHELDPDWDTPDPLEANQRGRRARTVRSAHRRPKR